jgi:hypothetical protein
LRLFAITETRETAFASSSWSLQAWVVGWPDQAKYGEPGGYGSLAHHQIGCGGFRVLSRFQMILAADNKTYQYQYRYVWLSQQSVHKSLPTEDGIALPVYSRVLQAQCIAREASTEAQYL